jgi:hypothetical protein
MTSPRHPITIPFILAWVLFAVSMFLDAYESMKGWACAWFCMGVFADSLTDEFWPRLYYFLFTVTNVAMTLSPIAVLRFFSRRRFLLGTTIFAWICALYVISWGVINAMNTSPDELQIGYYVWVASFVIFAGEWMRQSIRQNLFRTELKESLETANQTL